MLYKFNEIIELIKDNEGVEFADFGKGTTDEWILRAETRLNFKFPPSYKWWLKNYGGGQIFGEEIYSIYEIDFDEVIGGDVVYINELNRKNGFNDSTQLTVCETIDGMFYFQMENLSGVEYPVFVNGRKYADNFIEFLIKRIKVN